MSVAPASPVYCQATFGYVDDAAQVSTTQPVIDARRADPSFDTHGFELLAHRSAVSDWTDVVHLQDVHAPEIDTLARSFSGCDQVVVYPPIVRSPSMAAVVDDYQPIQTVHSDFTDDYGRMIVESDRPYRAFLDPILDRLGLSTDDLASASRTAMLQFWRNTGPVTADQPLAFCDARSIGPDRLMRLVLPTYGGQRLDFETFLPRPPEEGEVDNWYTFPNLTADEVVALRTYDSDRVASGEPYWTPHCAFRDPHVADAPEHRRESVEMRALCIWS